MIIELVLSFFSNYLIEFMGVLLAGALVFRWVAYRSSKRDHVYYSSFTRELELNIDKDKESNVEIGDSNKYLADLLGRISQKLPNRNLRNTTRKKKAKEKESSEDNNGKKLVSLRDYMEGKQSLITSIQAEGSVFNCKTPPNFTELTRRIMSQDINWSKLLGHIPIEGVSRMIDILPGLFIVFGVFGTFIGISMALPEIAKIDFQNLEASGEILSRFVFNVTFAMKTSIAGIFFSLILTVLNTIVPIKDTRNRIFKKLETSMEILWYHVQSDQSIEKQMSEILPEILNVVKNMERHMYHHHPIEQQEIYESVDKKDVS